MLGTCDSKQTAMIHSDEWLLWPHAIHAGVFKPKMKEDNAQGMLLQIYCYQS